MIIPEEVPSWLADSVVGTVTYHSTTPHAAAAMIRQGVRIEASIIGSFGQGFYTTTVPDPIYGDVVIVTAIRLRQPLVGHLNEIEDYLDRLTDQLSPGSRHLTPALSRRIRRQLVAEGYDGIVVHDAGGDGVDYVIAIVDGITRIVAEQ